MGLPSPDLTPEFITAINSLKDPFRQLLDQHRPDFIVSDIFYPWTDDLGIRLVFHGSGAFCLAVGGAISAMSDSEVHGTDEPFVVPGMPHRIEMTKSQLMPTPPQFHNLRVRMGQSLRRSYGMILNTVYEFEAEYVDMMRMKTWQVGPVSLCNQDDVDKAARGGGSSEEPEHCLNWLDGKKPSSVLYICFGSLGRFTCAQLREIAAGLEASGHPFIWVIKNCGDKAEWMPEGFEERVVEGEGRGLVVTGWAPQILILNHRAIGGFMTHCGWNSCMEGASAGLPMITWPLFAEQFFNEKLMVNVLRIGVSVGSKVCSSDEELRTFVRSEEVMRAVRELMGSGEEADGRRMRAKEIAEMATKAVEEGGSSYNEMSRLIQELIDVKNGKQLVQQGDK